MEYIDGHDLAVVLARAGRLTPLKAASFALQICEGLAAAHAAGVVHRDLKPRQHHHRGRRPRRAHRLRDRPRARQRHHRPHRRHHRHTRLHGPGAGDRAARSTPALTSTRSASCSLRRSLAASPSRPTRRSPPRSPRLRGPAPDPRGLAEVPDLLAELLLRCLEREPADRPASAAELVESLRTWLSGHAPEAAITPSLAAGPRPRAPARELDRLTTTPLTAAATPRTTASPRATATTSGNHARRTQGLGARVAVLPFKVQGARDYDYLAEALAEAVIDVLGRTRRVEVVASSITHRFHDQRDASVVGQQLGVGFVVDATLQVGGERARAVVRLLDAEAGVQLWSGRFDTSLADPFAAQDLLGQQITEALRGELEIGVFRELASPQLIDTYRHARREVQRGFGASLTSAYSTLTEQLRAHPGFIPGHALIALIAVRAWFSASASPEIDWQKRATADLEEALRLAPDHPRDHLRQRHHRGAARRLASRRCRPPRDPRRGAHLPGRDPIPRQPQVRGRARRGGSAAAPRRHGPRPRPPRRPLRVRPLLGAARRLRRLRLGLQAPRRRSQTAAARSCSWAPASPLGEAPRTSSLACSRTRSKRRARSRTRSFGTSARPSARPSRSTPTSKRCSPTATRA
jgi:TolB-like protein